MRGVVIAAHATDAPVGGQPPGVTLTISGRSGADDGATGRELFALPALAAHEPDTDGAGATLGDAAAKVTVKIATTDLAATLCNEGVAAATTGKQLARTIVATVLVYGRHFRAVVPVVDDNASGKSPKLKC